MRIPCTRPLQFKRFWIGCGMVLVGLVVFASLKRDPPRLGFLFDINIGHVLGYAWLMFWFVQIFRSTAARLGIALALGLLGVGLECLQAATDYRTFAYADMWDNALGIAAGFLLALSPLRGFLSALETVWARWTKRA